MDNRDTRAVLEYHEATKHSESSIRASRHTLDSENQPLPFKVYRDLEPIELVKDFPSGGVPALAAIAESAEPPAPDDAERIPDLTTLSRVLYLSAGITKRRPHPGGATYFRAYPNTGALYHIDLYLIVNAVEGLAPGAYHHRRGDASLELLREGFFREPAGRLGLGQRLPADAAVNVYCLAHLPRALERFGNRGYRAAQLEAAVIGGRIYLAAYAQRFGGSGLTFFDDEVTEFFSPHAAGKSVMFLVALGHPDRVALGLAS